MRKISPSRIFFVSYESIMVPQNIYAHGCTYLTLAGIKIKKSISLSLSLGSLRVCVRESFCLYFICILLFFRTEKKSIMATLEFNPKEVNCIFKQKLKKKSPPKTLILHFFVTLFLFFFLK